MVFPLWAGREIALLARGSVAVFDFGFFRLE